MTQYGSMPGSRGQVRRKTEDGHFYFFWYGKETDHGKKMIQNRNMAVRIGALPERSMYRTDMRRQSGKENGL